MVSVIAIILEPAILGLPQPSTRTLLIAVGMVFLLFAAGVFATSRPRVKVKIDAGYERAFGWIERAITTWQTEDRLTEEEAEQLRTELREPDFAAVLPHFGVHLTIGLFLRFPIGSITRAAYVATNMALTHIRFAARRINAKTFRTQMSIHSPIVLVISCLPGIGTFAYLGSKPFRAHRLLARVALDAALTKLPKNIYQRTGLRAAIAKTPIEKPPSGAEENERGFRIRFVPAKIIWLLFVIAFVFFAMDVAVQTVDHVYAPRSEGWKQISRILDLNSEASLGTWLVIVLLFICAVMLALIARATHQMGDRFAHHWALLALVAFGVSLDEQAKFHDAGGGDQLRAALGIGGILYAGWGLVALVSVVAIAVAYREFIFQLPSSIRNGFILASGFYVGGEVLLEMFSGWIMDTQGETYAYRTVTSFEEFLGMIGVLFALATLLVYVRTTIGILSFQIIRDVPAVTIEQRKATASHVSAPLPEETAVIAAASIHGTTGSGQSIGGVVHAIHSRERRQHNIEDIAASGR